MWRANSTAEKIAPQGLTANNLEAFWMPFTANRRFDRRRGCWSAPRA